MEDIFIGEIEDIELKYTRKNKRYAMVTIDGQIYSAWDKDFLKTYQVGDKVQFAYEMNGRFANLTHVELIEPAKEKVPNVEGKERLPAVDDDVESFLEYDNKKSRQIARLSCLKSASSIVSSTKNGEMDLDTLAKYTIDVSKTFEKYVLGGSKKRKKKDKEAAETAQVPTTAVTGDTPAGPRQEQDLPF